MRSRQYATRFVFIGLFATMLLSSWAQGAPRSTADHRKLYIEALRSVDFERWVESLMLLTAASRAEPKAGEWIRLYGMRYEPYLPHYQLGVCLFQLGQYEEATAAWRESRRQGAILQKRNRRWLEDLEGFEHQLQKDLSTASPSLRRLLASTSDEFDSLQSSAATANADFASRLAEVGQLLTTATFQVAHFDASSDSVNHDAATAALRRVREELKPLAATRLNVEASLAEQRRLQLAEEQRQQRLQHLQVIAAQLAVEPCAVAPADALHALLSEDSPAASTAPTDLWPNLISTHLDCGRLDQAAAALTAARAVGIAAQQLSSLSGRLKSTRQANKLVALYEAAGQSLAADRCDLSAISKLGELLQVTDWRRAAGQPAATWTPHLLLARAELACGDLTAASGYLETSEQVAIASAQQIAAVRADIERPQTAATQQRRLELRRQRLAAETQRLQVPGCQPLALAAVSRLLDTVSASPTEVQALVRGYLACHRPDAAERMVEQFPAAAGELSSQVTALRQSLATKRHLEETAGELLTGLLQLQLGDCDREAIALVRRHRGQLAAHPDAASLVPKSTDLVLAKGFRNCDDLPATRAQVQRIITHDSQQDDPELSELQRWIRSTNNLGIYDQSHALIIAAWDYRGGWQTLDGPQEDAKAVGTTLKQHGFSVQVLKNPNKDELATGIKEFIEKHGSQVSNRLLFYYAGHGWIETNYGNNLGYIIPTDAPLPVAGEGGHLLRFISMDQYKTWAKEIRAHHALFVFDSCFSGAVFEATRSAREMSTKPATVEELIAKPVRLFLTAGDEHEEVPDISYFRRAFIAALEGKADRDRDDMVLGQEIASYVYEQVSSQSTTHPRWGTMLAGQLGLGDLLFRGSERSPTTRSGRADVKHRMNSLRTELELWQAIGADRADDADAYRGYLDDHPNGHFADLARLVIERLEPGGGVSQFVGNSSATM